jgi:hypothetical protein
MNLAGQSTAGATQGLAVPHRATPARDTGIGGGIDGGIGGGIAGFLVI